MNFKINETQQKLRGGYYTPPKLALALARWALNGSSEVRLLEPSCGDGAFLEAVQTASINSLPRNIDVHIDAVELNGKEILKAQNRLSGNGISKRREGFHNLDFFKWISLPTNRKREWDVIIGNPPYIRYQYFDLDQRILAQRIFENAGLPFTQRTNAWVPFVISSIQHLAPGGRMAFVLPAEIMHIMHASGLRSLLEQEMSEITIWNLKDMVFNEVLQGVVLLTTVRKNRPFQPLRSRIATSGLFDSFTDEKPAEITICEVQNSEHLPDLLVPTMVPTVHTDGEWMFGLLTPAERCITEKVTALDEVQRFTHYASVDIGIVTGANDFFVVDEQTRDAYGLGEISYPMLAKSDLIKGITYKSKDHKQNVLRGRKVFFLRFPESAPSKLPSLMKKYIAIGESQNLHERYKCRIRSPWYCVPYVWTSEMALLKRCHLFPKLVVNEMGAYSTDTAYRIRLNEEFVDKKDALAFSFLNSFTLLHAEILGRHYGGGVLELVPSEIERLPIPLYEPTSTEFETLDRMVRSSVGQSDILDYVDDLVLYKFLHLSRPDIKLLRKAHLRLQNRRLRTIQEPLFKPKLEIGLIPHRVAA
jgi:adenine-specific DNA-methyltransferase